MAVYRRGYQRYQGPLTGRFTRLMVLPRFAWKRLLEQRLLVIILIVAMFWPLLCGLFIYLSNHADMLRGFGGNFEKLLRIDGQFFVVFMNTQAVFVTVLAAFAGPSLIAPDLTNNALPLYFSRPLNRTEYAGARLLVLVGLFSPVSWIPGLLLFWLQSSLAGWDWFTGNWRLGVGIFAGFLLWILLVGLVALACSAYVRWRIIAGGLVLGFFFVLAGVGGLVNGILRVDWGSAINPTTSINQVWRAMLGADPNDGPNALECASTLAGMAALLIWVLERKLRPVKVIS